MKRKKIIFAGGGSGGHAYPLMAVAREFSQEEFEIVFVSSYGSIEEKIVPRDGFRLTLIPSAKLKGQSPLGLAKAIFYLVGAFLRSLLIVFKERPNFVFSAGGYAGAPFLVTAAICGIPCGILEQNRIPGLANRWMARFCQMIFLNFAATRDQFAPQKSQVVGHPYRAELLSARWPQDEIRDRFERNPFRVFVFGGSQGAVGINRLICDALTSLKGLDIFIHHQTGLGDLERVKSEYAKAFFANALVEPYVYDMASAYRDAHLVICRAGASSLAELAAIGKAALLIPLVSKDRHQEPNAEVLADAGAALCRLQPDLDGAKLAAIVKDYYDNRQLLVNFARAIRNFDHPSAAKDIAIRIKEVLHAKA